MAKERPDALTVQTEVLLLDRKTKILEFAAEHRLPAIYGYRDFVDGGGLIFYGPSWTDLFRRAAIYVDKIIKGTKPGDLPVEQPTKFELVINLKTAKTLGGGAEGNCAGGRGRHEIKMSINPMHKDHAAPRCTAKSKRTGKRCRAPAVRGWKVCRMHGARGGGGL